MKNPLASLASGFKWWGNAFRRSPRGTPFRPSKPFRPPIRRDFEAGETGRLFADWSGDYGLTANELVNKLPTIRRRARQLAKDDSTTHKWLALCKTNIVGPDGFRFRMNVIDPITGNVDAMANRTLQAGFLRWARNPEWVDAAGKKDLKEFCDLSVMYWQRDGEAIIRLLPGFGWPENPFAFSLKMYRPDALDLNLNATLSNGRRIVCGVEHDSWGRPIAYHFLTAFDSYNNTPTYGGSGPHVRIPAEEIIHFYLEEEEDQPRGVPQCYAAMVSLKMAHGYAEAELVAAREAACAANVYSADDPDAVGPEKLEDGDVVVDREPGDNIVLPRGWKFSVTKPEHPNAVFAEFEKSMHRRTGNGLLLNYNSIANDLSDVNYTSLREGKLTEQDFWKCAQAFTVSRVLRRIFKGWLTATLTAGVYPLPISKFDKFNAPVFRGRRWPWVDPLKDAQASALNVSRAWETDSQVAEDMGNDYAENIRQGQADAALREGTVYEHLNTPPPPAAPAATAPPQEEPPA